MFLCRCPRALQLLTRIARQFSSASIPTLPDEGGGMEWKHIFIAATACRSPPPSITLSQAARRRRIAECVVAVSTFCEKRTSRQSSWNVDSLPTRVKESTRKLLPTVKNSRKRSRLEFVDVFPSQVP